MITCCSMDIPDKPIKIRKNTGELVPFDSEKLIDALKRSGANNDEIKTVIEQVKHSIFEGISTRRIYQIAYSKLYKLSSRAAGRYRLKKALLQLGPSGYPFEKFIAKLLELEGYETKTGQLIHGKCIKHEVDVVGIKGSKYLVAECKYHQSERAKNDVKISLYINSRFKDIKDKWLIETGANEHDFETLLITNTRFSEDALQYGKCAGLKLVSWDYPKGNSLKDWIDKSGFHPVTSLKSLLKKEKEELLKKGVVLCRQILENTDMLTGLSIPNRRRKKIIKEAESLI